MYDQLTQPSRDTGLKQRLRVLTHMRNRYLMGADLLGLLLIPAAAFLLRTESWEGLLFSWNIVAGYTLLFVAVKAILFFHFGLYRSLWAYASVPELITVLKANGLSASLEILPFLFIIFPMDLQPKDFPRSVPLLSALLTMVYVSGLRLAIRIVFTVVNRREKSAKLRPVLIVGAGSGGVMVARELQSNLQLGLDPVGFVDDDPKKSGKLVSGIPVFGPLADISWAVNRFDIQEVIIAIPAAPGGVIRRAAQLCKEAGVPSKITPGVYEILRGSARVTQVRQVQLEDLLRRGVVETDRTGVRTLISGARVLITGAGGSIGSEIVRQVRSFSPSEILLLGHGETSIFHITKELEELHTPGLTVRSIIADVRDVDRMDQVFKEFKPQVVFHAAAHKHVWLMEQNPADAITNNILGTRTVVQMADKYDVRRFVMVSSDKAVNPTSVMGVTKRIAELIVQDAANRTGKGFVTVRFGNVLGSRGSVVPIFKHQIEMGGPVNVTHPEVTRYFMTIPEAVQLVLQAASMGKGGEVFVLDMGEQLKVIDVARDLIRLSGFKEEEIGIAITGLKAGEKMYEELFYADDDPEKTVHDKVKVTRRNFAREYAGAGVHRASNDGPVYESPIWMDVDTLIEAAKGGDVRDMERLIRVLVPQYTPASEYGVQPEKEPVHKQNTNILPLALQARG
jgi:FlaA1/EpsC-like NDP-sugar epimerase